MKNADYITFLKDFASRFPSDVSQLSKSKGKKRTGEVWFEEVFHSLNFADCMEVSKRIMTGKLEGWNAYERDSIPAIYTRQVGALSSERARMAREQETRNREQSYVQPSATAGIWSTAKVVRQMRADGKDETEVSEYVESQFPADPESERRINCVACRDYGLVQIFHPLDLSSGKPTRRVYARCNCAAGSKYGKGWKGGTAPLPTFGERDWHVLASNPETAKAKVPQHQQALGF